MGKRRDNLAFTLVERGNRKRLRRLLRRHVELLSSDTAMLVYAAIWRHWGMLRWLLERGLSPDCRMGKGGNTPLMDAAAHGDCRTIQLLLEFGADPAALNSESENPLGFAVTWQQAKAVELLVAAGVDVNNIDDSGPGKTQLDWAELSQWTDMVTLLRGLGAKRYCELADHL